MYKKKEIWIIILIILLTICLAIAPTVLSCNHTKNVDSTTVSETTETEESNYIEIIIVGELTIEQLEVLVPKGASYGYIITKAKPYLNQYSIVESNMSQRYYKDTVIKIESYDTNVYQVEEVVDKICINTASTVELQSLYGIGEKRAKSIMEYRKTNTIATWESLRSLLGVSNEVIEAIKEKAIL